VKYVIAYDIDDDAIRERVADLLGTCGWRVQRSVFECRLDHEDDLEGLCAALARLLQGGAERNVRIYRLCQNCELAAVGVGNIDPPPDEAPAIVL